MPRRSLIEQLDDALQGLIRNPGTPLPGGDAGVNRLVRIAAELRDLPRKDFKMRLKNDLERSISMATTTAPIAATRTFAAPRLTFKNTAKAIEFYKQAFGATETMRFELETGIPHAEVVIGDSVIMLTDEWPEGGRYSAETTGSSPVSMSIQVPDVDAFVERAVAAGAKLAHPVADQFYG
ncbi:MAG: VOC family protein, partial [Terriglobales bacterium]